MSGLSVFDELSKSTDYVIGIISMCVCFNMCGEQFICLFDLKRSL